MLHPARPCLNCDLSDSGQRNIRWRVESHLSAGGVGTRARLYCTVNIQARKMLKLSTALCLKSSLTRENCQHSSYQFSYSCTYWCLEPPFNFGRKWILPTLSTNCQCFFRPSLIDTSPAGGSQDLLTFITSPFWWKGKWTKFKAQVWYLCIFNCGKHCSTKEFNIPSYSSWFLNPKIINFNPLTPTTLICR